MVLATSSVQDYPTWDASSNHWLFWCLQNFSRMELPLITHWLQFFSVSLVKTPSNAAWISTSFNPSSKLHIQLFCPCMDHGCIQESLVLVELMSIDGEYLTSKNNAGDIFYHNWCLSTVKVKQLQIRLGLLLEEDIFGQCFHLLNECEGSYKEPKSSKRPFYQCFQIQLQTLLQWSLI